MKWDEFAFVNQQLAAMLRTGIPLEGALAQTCREMARGKLRGELEALRADLAVGTPLSEALAQRTLPVFYIRMLQAGAAGNDLPGVLTLVADYYQHTHSVWTRLKGLLIYPGIVVCVSFGVALLLALLLDAMRFGAAGLFQDFLEGKALPALTLFVFQYGKWGAWAPVYLAAGLGLFGVFVVTLPSLRNWLRWRVPGFREASLWQMAATLDLLVRGGCPLPVALELVSQLEGESPAAQELLEWQRAIETGQVLPNDIPTGSALVPLFRWLVASAGEDVSAGLRRAAQLYQSRAEYRIELLLQVSQPLSIVLLASVVGIQVVTLVLLIIGSFLPLVSL